MVPLRPAERVPAAVVEIVPVRVVEIVPALVVEMVPVLEEHGTEITNTSIAEQKIQLNVFIDFSPGGKYVSFGGLNSSSAKPWPTFC
jgi:hypothetical protein